MNRATRPTTSGSIPGELHGPEAPRSLHTSAASGLSDPTPNAGPLLLQGVDATTIGGRSRPHPFNGEWT